jgi:hypothetical protein
MITISIPYGSKMIQVPSKDTFLWGMIYGAKSFSQEVCGSKSPQGLSATKCASSQTSVLPSGKLNTP